VHVETSELGYNYSYICERPMYEQPASWFEFNDDTVSSFDPSCIEANCFGGPNLSDARTLPLDKNYSAYMLCSSTSGRLC